MANNTFLHANNDLAGAANWSLGALSDADSLIFPAGTQSVSVNMDQSAKNFTSIYVHKECGTQFGAPGNPFKCGADKVIHKGYGAMYLQAESDVANELDYVIVDSDNADGALFLSSDGTDYCTRLFVAKGKVEIQASHTPAIRVFVSYRANPTNDAIVNVVNGVDLTALHMNGGVVTSDAAATAIYMAGGMFTQSSTSNAAITSVDLNSGLFIQNSTGTLGSLYLRGGIADYLRTGKAKTITSLHRFTGATLRKNDELLTVTNTFDFSPDVD